MKKWLLYIAATLLFMISPYSVAIAAPLDEVKQLVRDHYMGKVNGNLGQASTIEDVVTMLDPYSTYFTEEEFEEFLNSVDYKSVGIGVVIEKHEKGILLLQVIEGGSAEQAGIVPGDIIIEINGQSAAPMSVQEASSLILGDENTTVTLKVLKENNTTTTMDIVRKPFAIPNVTSELLYGNIGYIHLSSFSSDAVQLVREAYEQLANQGATSYILDLQYNGGGYVDTAQALIGMFPNTTNAYKLTMKKKTAMIYDYPATTIIEKAQRQRSVFPQNTKLLVNGYSASASEMTAVALKDQQAAILYGSTTYGKGSMQDFFPLSDGSYLKLTVGIFSGPSGTAVNEVGVKPTIETTTDPIFAAHFDSITEQLTSYRKLPSLTNVPPSKIFTIKLKNEVQPATVTTNAIELVALGSNETVDVTLEVNGSNIEIKPLQPLSADVEYILIIHPTIQYKTGQTIKTGGYLHVTVTSSKN